MMSAAAVNDLAADGLIVKFRPTTNQTSQIHALSTSGLQSVESFELVPGLIHVRAVAGETLQGTLSSILTNPNVEYAEPNYYVTALGIPNDPDFSKQYGLQNNGQTGGSVAADISIVDSWDMQTGKDVIIAVVDTGVEYTHEDLATNIWTNSGEIPANGIDDDNNGFIDDVYGWDFSNNDNDPLDDMGHGTHVAGIIAATTNNGIGISGINWNAKIMSLKFIDGAGIGTTTNAIKAINYAVAMGAKVSNNSWGGGAFTQGLYETLVAANQAGHLFVAASGNNSLNSDDPSNSLHYPSSYTLENVISVAATDEFDRLGSFSNYGAVSVDLAAPGRQILSLWLNNSYISLDGTSMAAPFVAGAAGLLLSTLPNLTIPQLRSALLDNVDPLASLNGLTVTGGRLNVLKALKSVTANIQITPDSKHIAINDSMPFFASGGSLPYTWSVSRPAVAQIDSASGLFVAIQRGVTQVMVQDSNGFSAKTSDIIVDQLTFTPVTATLNVGQTLQFTTDGGVPPYSWSSTNLNAIQIDNVTGLATAMAAGQGLINLTDSNGLTFLSGLIEVVFIPDLLLSKPVDSLSVGEVYQLNVSGGIPPYTFGSMDLSIAMVDANGLMRAVGPGMAQIYVADTSGKRVEYNDIEIQNIQVFNTISTMRINEAQTLNVIGGTPPFEWRVTNSLLATVDSSGLLTALGTGSIKVTVMDLDGNLALTDIIFISDSTALTITTPMTTVSKGQQIPLTITGGVMPYEWRVSNAAVLSIDENNQVARALGAGVSYITVTDSLGETVSSNIIEVRDISIFPQTKQFLMSDNIQFSASGGIEPYRWTVDDMSIATIDASGKLSAKTTGLITVTVKDADGIMALSENISLINAGVLKPAFHITPRSATLSRRSSNGLTFTATGGVSPYRYSLSNPLGIINAATGEYSPLSTAAGTTTILATDALGNMSESGTIFVR